MQIQIHIHHSIFIHHLIGKDKCIELKISLYDECDQKVLSRIVPLKATLMYECGQEVQQQNILVINLHESKVSIDESGNIYVNIYIP
jgi:hypothetical protein